MLDSYRANYSIIFFYLDLDIKVPHGSAFTIETPPNLPKMHQVMVTVGKRGSGKSYAANNICTWVFGTAGTTQALTSGTTTLYINGASVGSMTRSGWAGTLSSTFDYIGNTQNNDYLNGQMVYMSIFSSALSNSDRLINEAAQ